MRKLLSLGILLCGFLPTVALGQDTHAIIEQEVDNIILAINEGNYQDMIQQVSVDASEEFVTSLAERLANKRIQYLYQLLSIEPIEGTDHFQATIKYAIDAEGPNGSFSSQGLKTSLVFVPEDGERKLTDSDFVDSLSFGGMIYLLIIPFALLLLGLGFRIWMLIDAATRSIDNKIVWILIILFFSFIGAIVYFVGPRRSHKRTHGSVTSSDNMTQTKATTPDPYALG